MTAKYAIEPEGRIRRAPRRTPPVVNFSLLSMDATGVQLLLFENTTIPSHF